MCTLEQTHRHKTKYSYEVAALDLSSSGRDVRCHRCTISGKHIKQVELFKLEKRKTWVLLLAAFASKSKCNLFFTKSKLFSNAEMAVKLARLRWYPVQLSAIKNTNYFKIKPTPILFLFSVMEYVIKSDSSK